jgi:prepilin-type N-terminal cleavage/methylation domain-containing protein
MRRGFTLVETLAVVLVVGVVFGLALPSFWSAKRTGADAVSLSNMRQHAQMVSVYAGDHRDRAPFFADPGREVSVVEGGGRRASFEFFDISDVWYIGMADAYYGASLLDGMGVFARPEPDAIGYQYSPTFVTRPAFWTDQRTGPSEFGAVPLSAVRSPANKAVFLEWDEARGLPVWVGERPTRRADWAFAFVDGSARRPDPDSLARPDPRGEGSDHGARFGFGVVGLHTADGVLGRDVR